MTTTRTVNAAGDIGPVPGVGQHILALDAAGGACSVALGRVTASVPLVLAAERQVMQHGHAAALVPMIDAVMSAAGLDMAAVDVVAVGIGPGGFTGLRIALATARGLGLALNKPVMGISNFQAAAWRALADDSSKGSAVTGDIAVLLDSRRSEPFAAWLAPDLGFRAPPTLLVPAALERFIARAAPGLVTGDWDAWGDLPVPGRIIPAMADAAAILHLAADSAGRFRAAAQPCYLREPDASLPAASVSVTS